MSGTEPADESRVGAGLRVRPATHDDWPEIRPILRAVLAAGASFADEATLDDAAARAGWLDPPRHPFVGLNAAGRIVGSFCLKPNQPGRGAHVANASYLTAPWARGRGVGRALGTASLTEAAWLGFRALQFNLVVATNAPAVRLWTGLGFRTAGRLPGAFRHATRGCVDALVMFREVP